MSDPARNRCESSDLSEAEVEAALERIAARDAEMAQEASGVFDSLTWGEGPSMIRLAGLQEWLWYVLPTKYMTDEVGYMGRLADAAAVLFDELGLHGYALVCRSEVTAGVHAAFDRSDSEGRVAMSKAMQGSGIEPPDIDDFAWGQVMGIGESTARSAVEDALERAIAEGELTVGGRGWRRRQTEITAATLDSDHPVETDQSWRTVVVAERVQYWVEGSVGRAPSLAQLRGGVADRLLHPIDPPADVADVVAPIVWFLEAFGETQPLTQAGYLPRELVQRLHREASWHDPAALDRTPRSELDSGLVHYLRGWSQAAGVLRKHKKTLRRTPLGASAVSDVGVAWGLLTGNLADDPWDRFVVETAGLVMLDRGVEIGRSELFAVVAQMASELGWSTIVDGVRRVPGEREVSQAFFGALLVLKVCGVVVESGEWSDRRFVLSEAGVVTMLAATRASAVRPREGLW